jgi:MYXO-CTERM domain-containing protein
MSELLRSGKLGALVLFLAAAPGVRADLITPDSIPSPPPVSLATNGGRIPQGGWVTDQYVGKGLSFPFRMTGVDTGLSTAIVQVAGVKVWTGANAVDGGLLGGVSFSAGVRADLVVPGTQQPARTDSLRVHLLASGGSGMASALIEGLDANGKDVSVQRSSITEDGAGTWVTLSGPGLHSFEVTAYPGLVPMCSNAAPFIWGVAGVEVQGSVQPASADPEPRTLTLAGMGLLGLAGYAWKRRRRP